jgi:anti-anti-sigma factor
MRNRTFSLPVPIQAPTGPDQRVLVRIEGAVGITGLDPLQVAFAEVLAHRAALAILDLERLTALSTLAMGMLVQFCRNLARWNGRVALANCPPRIREALQRASLAHLFEFTPTVEDALRTE